jgi:mono/diheme cytochrome c family protein
VKALTIVTAIVAVAAAALLLFAYSGIYDIGATRPHFDATSRFIRIVLEQSVKRRARDIAVPELDDPAKVHNGFRSFQAMCVVCHGASGTPPSDIGQGLYPHPPELADAVRQWTPAELFVITKHGIKMTGMPAWGATHTDEQLWEIVAFMNVLPAMPPHEYRAAVEFVAAGERTPRSAPHVHH